MGRLYEDLRYTLRQWKHRPALAAVIITTLALGIGANAAIFSVVDSVLLAPLDYRQPERLVTVYSQFPSLGFDHFWVSPPEYLEYQRWVTTLSDLGAYRVRSANVTGSDEPRRVTGAVASASLFSTLGVEARLGRTFLPEEDLPDAEPVVLLGEDLWRSAFGGDRELIGETIEINGMRRTVVGVMPSTFDVDDAGVELWVPLALDPADPGGRGSHYLNLIGRLAEGASVPAARQEVAALQERWQTEFPDTHIPHPERHPFVIDSLKEELVGKARPAVLLLAGAVALVLLVACANVANLLLARAEARQREIAVRTALGAGSGHLLRQFFTESLLLSLVGGGVGIGFAFVGINALLAANPDGIVRLDAVELNPRVLLFTLGVAVFTGILFGLAPALHARSRSFFLSLKEGGRATVGRRRRAFRASLVVAEVALAAMLVVGAGLLLKSFWNLQQIPPGFDPSGVLTFQLSPTDTAYPEGPDVQAFYDRLIERLESLPGVEAASVMTGLPPVREVDANDTEFEGVPEPPEGPPQNVDYYQFAGVDYFDVLKIPLSRGRSFESGDVGGTPVVLVNRRLAQVFWPEQDPIGRRIRSCCGDEIPWFHVIGVVEDVKQGGLDRPVGTELYFLAEQVSNAMGYALRTREVVVRSQGDPLALAAAVRAEVRRLDPSLPVARLQPLQAVVANSLAGSRFLTLLVSIFGAVALLLAAVGTYGVISYSVEEQQHEIGVRLALGADTSRVMAMVLGKGMRLVGVGLLLGLAGAWGARRTIESVLYGVAPGDGLTFSSVAILLVAVALVACLLPARRAMRVDPIVTLRGE